MKPETYEITDADGTRYAYDAEMLDESMALSLAQEIADREGETVYIHGPGEVYEDGYEIEPSAAEPAPAVCGCGAWTGEPCQADAATVLVEWMPEHIRSSHEAAGNSGSYPHNGALRVWCHQDCADAIVADAPGWSRIVRTREIAAAVRS